MARIFSDGAEFGDMLFWTSAGGGSANSNPAYVRSGTYCYLIGEGGASIKIISPLSEFYLRYGLYNLAYEWDYYVSFNYGATGIASIGVRSVGGIRYVAAYVNGGLVDTGTIPIPANTKHLLEVHFVMGDSGTIETKLNGINDIDYHGDTKPGADTTIDRIIFNTPGYSYGYYIDDLALNDTSGIVDNSWCGDEHYEYHPANDNGDTNDWTGSDGDKVNNYALVDEIPPTGDTDYVKSSTPAEQDMYKITSFTDTGKVVTRLWSECRARDSNALSGEIKIGFKTGGTVYLCSTDRVLSSNYMRVVGDDALVNPADSGVWEKADLDALQFVAECE